MFKCLWNPIVQTYFLIFFEYVEFNGGVHFFCFQLEISFLGKVGPKNKIDSLSLNLTTRLIRIWRIRCWSSPFLFFLAKIPYFDKFSPKIKIVSLSWNLIPRFPDKIFETKWRDPVKLDRKRKVCYLFLRLFYWYCRCLTSWTKTGH